MDYKFILQLIMVLYRMRKFIWFKKDRRTLSLMCSRLFTSETELYLGVFLIYIIIPALFSWILFLGWSASFLWFVRTNNVLMSLAVMLLFVSLGLILGHMLLINTPKAKIKLRLYVVEE